MEIHADSTLWPPSIGDYVRLRRGGTLAEVIDISIARTNARYTLNIFSENMAEPVSYRLDEIESVWKGWPSAFAGRRRNLKRAPGWRIGTTS